MNIPNSNDDNNAPKNTITSTADEVTPLLQNSTPRDHAEDTVPELSKKRLFIIILSVCFGVFLGALDSTIIATLSAPIATHFSSLNLLSWLASAYLIANAACQPLLGRLTDIFSRRKGLIVCNVLFAIGNLVSGLAISEGMMITGRVIAGLGGGGLMAITNFVSSDLIPLRKRSLVHAIVNASYCAGAGLGSFLGGWINDTWGWRWAFLIQVPMTMISCTMVWYVVRIPVKKSSISALARIDFAGAFTLLLFIVLLLTGLNSAGNIVPWSHPLIPATLVLSILSLMLFVYIEANIALEPIIPVKLLTRRTVASACFSTWFASMVMYMLLFYIPIFYQVKGLSATEAGERIIPQFFGHILSSLTCGLIINATGLYKRPYYGVLAIFCLGTGLLTTVSLDGPEWHIYIYQFMVGAGYSGILTITVVATIAAVSQEHQAVITSAIFAFRSTGATIGVTIASVVYQNLLISGLHKKFDGFPGSQDEIQRIRDSLDELKHLPKEWIEGVHGVFDTALRGVFLIAFLCTVCASISGLFLRQHVLHTRLLRDDVVK